MAEKQVNIVDNLAYYFKIARPYILSFGIVLAIITIAVSIDISQNYIYKLLIDSGTGFATGTVTRDAFIATIVSLGIFFILSVIIQASMRYARLFFVNRMETRMMFDVKKDIFDHLLNLSHSFHVSHRTGSLISRLIRSGSSVETLTDFFAFQGSPAFIKVMVSFVVISLFDFWSAISVLVMVTCFVGFSAIMIRKQQFANVERNEAEDYEKGFISDVFTNIETVKHFGKEGRISAKFSSIAKSTLSKYLNFWEYYNKIESGHILIIGFGTVAVMFFTLTRFLAGELSIGSVVFIYTSYFSLTQPLYEFFWGVRRFYEATTDLEQIVRYKKTKQDVVDAQNAKKLKISKGAIEFCDVDFSYTKKKEIIKDFSLKINPEEKIAFVGLSGAGKTTIIKLLYRFYDVDRGQIVIDGRNIKSVTQDSLRNELSIVPQECVLFNDTIYNNIHFSNPGATRADVVRAIKASQLYDFIQTLPDKENTIVGERGVKLSGGEKQRVSIARALLADKKVLVLDEATSSLDSKTEFQIRVALEKLMKGRTTIIIAHRLSTIMNADRIVVMKKGRIEQIGSHEELTNKKGVYSSLWALQKTGAIKK
jgi:ATP-binding cassette subfamily B protein